MLEDKVDWVDVERHALGAVAGMMVLAALDTFGAAAIVTAAGIAREALQQWLRSRRVNPLAWSIQKWLEAAVWPAVAFPMAWYGVGVCS
jgi:hypothetical protein